MNTGAPDSYEVSHELDAGAEVQPKLRRGVYLAVNDLIQMQIPDDPNSFSFRSRIDDIVRGRLHIAWPTDRGVRVPIRKQQTLTLTFARDDAIYAMTGIVEQLWRAPLAQLSVFAIGPPQRIQRRQFFRVKSLLPVELMGEVPSLDDSDRAPKVVAVKTHTFEISGSGLAIRHRSSIPPGTLLECKLTLPLESAKMKILCKVVHSSRVTPMTESPLYHVGMYFLSMREADRTHIVRHVFGVERSHGPTATGHPRFHHRATSTPRAK